MNGFKIYPIKKVASTTAQFYNSILTSKTDLHICLIREPVERFWSACKTMHPDLTFLNQIETDGKIVEPSNVKNIDLEAVIESCIRGLKATVVDSHFLPQRYLMHGNKFHIVLEMKDLKKELINLYKSSRIELIGETEDQLRKHLKTAFLQFVDEHDGKPIPENDTKMQKAREMLHMNESPKELDAKAYEILRKEKFAFELTRYYSDDFFIWNNRHLLLRNSEVNELYF